MSPSPSIMSSYTFVSNTFVSNTPSTTNLAANGKSISCPFLLGEAASVYLIVKTLLSSSFGSSVTPSSIMTNSTVKLSSASSSDTSRWIKGAVVWMGRVKSVYSANAETSEVLTCSIVVPSSLIVTYEASLIDLSLVN